MEETNTAAGLYARLTSDRDSFLERGRRCAEVTIPALLPPSGHSGSADLPDPYQSVGARGVNNLANKLLLAILPPNTPFFRLMVDDYTLEELTQEDDKRAEVEKALNRHERAVMTALERRGFRNPVVEALKLLVVSGNSLVILPEHTKPRVYRMDTFAVRRSPDGTVLDLVVEEQIAFAALPSDVRSLLIQKDYDAEKYKDDSVLKIYTAYTLEDGRYRTYQEVEGLEIPGSTGFYPKDSPNFLALRWTHIDGEHYGRGHVEEYIGDLNALEGLSKAILEASIAAAKVQFLVKPNATTREKTLKELPNGGIGTGDADNDVTVLRLDKQADMQVAMQVANGIEQRLSFAFLMNTSIQRNAERVTAEEIRFMAGELEDALGGVYSLLSQEFQLPLVKLIMRQMEKAQKLPKLPKEVVEPSIVTGLEALGRGHDLNKLDVFVARIAQLGEPAMARLNMGDVITRIGTSLGIDTNGLVKTQQELEEEQARQQQLMQQQQMMEIAKSAAPQVARQMGGSEGN